ncbi:MAG: hypothetical protein Q7K57_57585 [Burkholderiaceae bacterium]|nr:hypothetical protein [Polaromonas sp.]MDO8778182.1 hypothetical protein [Burkholderiaceae bacterium]
METTEEFLNRITAESERLDKALAAGTITTEEHGRKMAILWAEEIPPSTAIAELQSLQAESQANQAQFLAESEFDASDEYLGEDYGIAIDRTRRKVGLIRFGYRTVISFAELVSSEVCVDSETVVKTGRVGQLGAALVGGVVLGGIGALIGAMGASKKQANNIRAVELKVLTTDAKRPIHTVTFFDGKAPYSAERALKAASHWHDLISVAIRETHIATEQATAGKGKGLPNELEKLWHLKTVGALSEVEYQAAKARLLSA